MREIKEEKVAKVDDGLAAKVRKLEEKIAKMSANWKAFCVKHVGDDDDGKIGSVKTILLASIAAICVCGLVIAGNVDKKEVNGGSYSLDESGGTMTLTVDAVSSAAIASSGSLASTSTADGANTRVMVRASIGSDDWAIGTNSLGVTIPDNAVVFDGYVDVTSGFFGTNVNRKVGLELQSAGDLITVATNNILSAGINAIAPVGTAASAIKMTAERTLSFVVEDFAITNGTATVVLYYDLMAR